MTAKDFIIPSLALACTIGLLIHTPIPQNPSYHNFVDQRALFGITNFWNVITNLPFAIVGFIGLGTARLLQEKKLKQIFTTLFTGFILVAIGSGYYHLYPGNITLVYDRLPITIVLMSFFAFIIYDHISRRTGYNAFFIFNIIGLTSVIYWIWTEQAGHGDLRWYAMVQFFPIIAIPLIMFLYYASRTEWREIVIIFVFFGLAKLMEGFDKEVYRMLYNTLSGHSLKHLFMVAAEYEIVVLTRRSTKVKGSKNKTNSLLNKI